MTKDERHLLFSDSYEEQEAIKKSNEEEGLPTNDEYIWEILRENLESLIFDMEEINKKISGQLVIIADLGLWNGRRSGYKLINNLEECTENLHEEIEIFVKDGDLQIKTSHHDGTNYMTVREIPDENNVEKVCELVYNDAFDMNEDKLTKKIGYLFKEFYGWIEVKND